MLLRLNDLVHNFVWGPGMLLFFLGCGVYFTIGTRFFQLTNWRLWVNKTIGSLFKREAHDKSDAHAISTFETFTTALGATLGTGNIVGVATALAAGGAGAIFWMWVCSIFGMMTGFSENVLGMLYRKRGKNGAWQGGPMYYLEKGARSKLLAVLFAVFAVFASFGMGNMAQSNSISGALNESFGISPLATALCLTVFLLFVSAGGIKRIGVITSKLIPITSAIYIVGCLIILFIFRANILSSFISIFTNAFDFTSVAGGIGGFAAMQAMRYGVARGIFSNEAGLGSSVLVHASTNAKEPVEIGMWSMLEIFIDTIVICTLTALAVLSSGALQTNTNGPALAVETFRLGFGSLGTTFLSVAISLFAVSTLLTWSYTGELAIEYLFGEKSKKLYRYLFIFLIPVGCLTELTVVWKISDTFNGLMALPNLCGIIILSSTVFRETKKYLAKQANGTK